jgi:Bifunctional DNA primase/polymerase, N-terminal/Primase C terminal 2 (PriCT-2)
MILSTHTIYVKKNNSLLEHALKYAEKGWPVFPVRPSNKIPYTEAGDINDQNWSQTTDPDAIKYLWEKLPNANIAAATGPTAGIWGLDIDTIEGHPGGADGLASLAALEREHGPLPLTLQATTPSGGRHYYFLYPTDGTTIRKAIPSPGIEAKGDGQMFVLPPSRKPVVGEYKWVDERVPIAAAPKWLLDLVIYRPRIIPADFSQQQQQERPRTNEEFRRLTTALEKLPANCSYDVWFKVLCALKNEFGEAGRAVAHEWSITGAKHNDSDFNSQWQKHKPR